VEGIEMAANEKVINTGIKFDAKTAEQLKNLDGIMEQGEKAVEGLEKAGLNVTALKEELAAAKLKREVLLKYFG